MRNLRSAQIAELRDRLDNRKRDLLKDIRRELLQSDQQHYREVAGMVTDVGDESVANLIADLDAAAIDRDVLELRAIEAARRRLQQGTYGVCRDCSNAIPWPRLLAEPAAERCLPCAQHHEKSHAHASTPTL